jgi:photosynthetic reaction center cytochrome c subunit
MNRAAHSRCRIGGIILLLLIVAGLRPLTAQSPPAEGPPLKAEEFYKNIRVLNGVPADQITPAMYFFASSLGVGCGFCHAPGLDRSPDTAMKSMARRMIVMTSALNNASFGGARDVTCYTCHRGASRPAVTPSTSVGAAAAAMPAPATGVESLPAADTLIDRHISAVGGAEALARMISFVARGSATDISGASTPFELIAKSPGLRVSERQGLKRDSPVGLLVDRGWLVDRVGRLRPMRIDEVDATKLEDGLWFPSRLKTFVKELQTTGIQVIRGRQVYVVTGRTPVLPEVDLFFDRESGLLVRAMYYTDVTVGRYPTQIDIDAYRPIADVRIPAGWTVSEILDRRVTYWIDEVEQNVAIEMGRFEKPSEPRRDH